MKETQIEENMFSQISQMSLEYCHFDITLKKITEIQILNNSKKIAENLTHICKICFLL